MSYPYAVQTTIRFLTGTLAGLDLPHSVGFGTLEGAERHKRLLERGKTIRAAGLKDRYQVVGPVTVRS